MNKTWFLFFARLTGARRKTRKLSSDTSSRGEQTTTLHSTQYTLHRQHTQMLSVKIYLIMKSIAWCHKEITNEWFTMRPETCIQKVNKANFDFMSSLDKQDIKHWILNLSCNAAFIVSKNTSNHSCTNL